MLVWYFVIVFAPLVAGGEPRIQDIGPFKTHAECEGTAQSWSGSWATRTGQ